MALSDIVPRKKLIFAESVREAAPAARARYFADKANALQLAQLAQSRTQFEQTLALQKEQMEQAQRNADTSNAIATVGLAKVAYPYIKQGAKSLADIGKTGASKISDLIFSSPTAPAAETTTAGLSTVAPALAAPSSYVAGDAAIADALAPAYQTPAYQSLVAEGAQAGGLGVGEGAISSGAESVLPSTGASAAPYNWIAAAIIGQHLAAQGTNRYVEGQRVGDVFSVDDQGRPSPWFLNDPWHEKLGTNWGFKRPSGGVNLEAAIKNSDWWNAGKRVSQGFNQWADPLGDFGYDVVENYLGPKATNRIGQYINPVAYYSDKAADAKDIGGFLTDVAGSGGIPGDPISATISGISNLISGKEKVFDTAKHILTGGLF